MLDYELVAVIDALVLTQGEKVEIRPYNVDDAIKHCTLLNVEFKKKYPIPSRRPFVGVGKYRQNYVVYYWPKKY
jgi:hypothetical protein